LAQARIEWTFSRDVVPAEEIVGRMIVSFIAFTLPPRGLDEAVTSLWEMFEYYRDAPASAQSLPGSSKLLSGTVVGKGERSPLALTE
jgi:hypothetical protein